MKLIVYKILVSLGNDYKTGVNIPGKPKVSWQINENANSVVYVAMEYEKFSKLEYSNKINWREDIINHVESLLKNGTIYTPFCCVKPYIEIDDSWTDDSDNKEPYWFFYQLSDTKTTSK